MKFSLSYGVFGPLLSIMGLGPRRSSVEVSAESLEVRMGWGFRASVSTNNVRSASFGSGMVGGIGIHGWRGRWLVNGSTAGIVKIVIDPPARASALGFPVSLRELSLSLDQPEAFVEALNGASGQQSTGA